MISLIIATLVTTLTPSFTEIREEATIICRVADKTDNGGEFSERLSMLIKNRTEEEQLLIRNCCIMFLEGRLYQLNFK